MTFRRSAAVLAVVASLAGCAWSEQAQIAAYFEEAQSLAERMAAVGGTFETLMNAQEDPLAWSDDEKRALDEQYGALKGLGDEAEGMTVPRAFSGAHPLLVQSIGEMAGAVDIIRGIAAEPDTATMEKADEMTRKAEQGEALANKYVSEVERILNEKYPEMMAEDAGE